MKRNCFTSEATARGRETLEKKTREQQGQTTARNQSKQDETLKMKKQKATLMQVFM